ncbi:sigma-54-dependent transcriptional regulator [Peredibacter sp. HCB2-198]|uniref:sigma-54-dependent transcriptional regulator n=1 Tax=Peredibacter sp. HCB2-198 TaxID=3383025 RepID=UPI0038B55FE6
MYQRKLMKKQIEFAGVRLGDSCSIFPSHGHRKAFTLNRYCIDLISSQYRPDNLSLSYIELPNSDVQHFHYRLELDQKADEGRFVLKTIKGNPFWLNGLAAREAYIERQDRIYIDDNKMNFDPFDLQELLNRHFEHPILLQQNLIESDLKILIVGETGTGKTHLASKIHEKSGRTGEFVSVNLSSFNPQLIESELFGHKKGAFTGAISDKIGAFKAAEHGTLFLDEVDSLPLDLQTKLLSFIDSNKFRRVGEMRETAIKTRLIFASGRPLEKLIQQEVFRKDFYFRLKSGHSIELKSLRNEVQRIREACQYYSLKNGVTISQRLLEFYETLAWPGNLRQLFGHLDKKRILSRYIKLDFDHLDEELLLQSSDLMSLAGTEKLVPLKDIKEDYVKKAFSLCEGNVALTARKLQLTEKTVRTILGKV